MTEDAGDTRLAAEVEAEVEVATMDAVQVALVARAVAEETMNHVHLTLKALQQ